METQTAESSGMIERRKTPRKDWVVVKDERGRSVLEWKVDYREKAGQEPDPGARTHDVLRKLSVPDLMLEEEGRRRVGRGRDPYDSTRRLKGKRRRKEKAQEEPGSK
jgi:hypothetical protein